MTIEFKIVEINNGHCQITYKSKNSENQTIFHCLQDNGEKFGGVRLLRCTRDYEPSYEVGLRDLPARFEMPKGDSKLEELCRKWITEKGYV